MRLTPLRLAGSVVRVARAQRDGARDLRLARHAPLHVVGVGRRPTTSL